MNTTIATPALPPTSVPRRLRRHIPLLLSCLSLWLALCNGRVPAFLSPTVARTLYIKLPVAATRFHWVFLDRRALLSGELTVRIVNAGRNRDETLVIFRNGTITDGWHIIGGETGGSSIYFGFVTGARFDTAVGDSVIVTLTAREELRGRGPYSQGTLAKGTWVATGTYSGLSGGTMNPFRDLVRLGKPPIAFLTCWDTAWELRDASDNGWMGPKPPDEDKVSMFEGLYLRGVDGRRCQSML